MKNEFLKEVLLSEVNFFIGVALLSSTALGAGLIIWQAALGENPLTNEFVHLMAQESTLP